MKKTSAGRKRRARESAAQRTLNLIVGPRSRKRNRETATARMERLAKPTNRHKLTPAYLKKADEQRVITPLVVKLRPGTTFTVISPDDLGHINVDESYQRMVIKSLVNKLIYVLRNGGDIPAPIHVARRRDGSLWILDGQQRFWAHLETATPLKAWIHPVDGIEDERDLYNVLNKKVQQGAMNAVKSSNTAAAACIRKWNESDHSPMFQKINFGSNAGRPYECTVLTRGLAAALTGLRNQGSTGDLLDRVDAEWRKNADRAEKIADAFLELTSLIWPGPYRVRLLSCWALGNVCRRRWATAITFPSRREIASLRRVNWEAVSPSKAMKFVSLYEAAIDRVWKSSESI